MHISWARLASFCHLGFISDPLIVSKFHNETQDPKGQENKESLGQEMVRRRLKHPDVLLVLLRIMKVLVETDEATEHLVKIN